MVAELAPAPRPVRRGTLTDSVRMGRNRTLHLSGDLHRALGWPKRVQVAADGPTLYISGHRAGDPPKGTLKCSGGAGAGGVGISGTAILRRARRWAPGGMVDLPHRLSGQTVIVDLSALPREAAQTIRERQHGRMLANAAARRILLQYATGRRTRRELSRAFHFSERQVQGVISGDAYGDATAPVRARLLDLGIGDDRMRRSRDRAEQVGRAFCRLATAAAELLEQDPRPAARQLVADVKLLLGDPDAIGETDHDD